ncbi:hypothetical protein WJX79_010488 [Trebouxia sp. C0005]
MSSVSASDELDARLALALDPFEDMCGPKSQNSVPSWKNTLKASKSPVKKALMLRAPSSQTISDIALLQREKTQLCQQMNQLENWVKGAESRHGNLIKANRHLRCTLEKADKELEMSRLKHDKLSEMLAAANAAQQGAEQQSRRLEIKFARSDKGHALMRSAKLQASVAELEAQLSQLQGDSHLKEEMLASSQAKVVELHNALRQHADKVGITDQQLILDNARMSSELESSMQYCQECEGQLSSLRQQSELSDKVATEAAAEAAKLQNQNEQLSQQLQDLKQKSSDAQEKAEANSRTYQAEVAQLHDRMQAAASRGAEEIDELRGGYEDRMSAMRAELQQQEVDKAALLDIVQDLEDRCSGEALTVAQANLAAAHDQERDSWQQERLTLLGRAKAADAEVVRLQQGAEGLKQERQKGLIEMRKAAQQWAVAQADLRSTRHQLKVLQSQASGLPPAPVTPDTPTKKEVASEDRLVAQMTSLQDEVKELRGVHGSCEALQQTVAQLKQKLVMEASKQMDLTGKLEAASRGPADLQNEQQLQEVWQQLVEMQAVPTGATVQEQGMYLKQQLAAFFDQLKAKDAELTAVQQQLQQAQHAQQAQRAQQPGQPSRQDTVYAADPEPVRDMASSHATVSPLTLAPSHRLPSKTMLSTVSARHLQSQSTSMVSGEEVAQGRVTQAVREGPGAVLREDSAQFGPEASAMSLPGDGEYAGTSAALSEAQSLRSISDGGSEPEDSKQSKHSTAARPPTLKQQLSDLHSSFKQMRSRYTPPQSRSLSRQSSLGGV